MSETKKAPTCGDCRFHVDSSEIVNNTGYINGKEVPISYVFGRCILSKIVVKRDAIFPACSYYENKEQFFAELEG